MEPKDKILLAGRYLLLVHGYKGVTTDAIAKRARVSKKTLYALFPSKDKLMEAILTFLLKGSMDRWDEIISGPQSAIDKLRTLVSFMTDLLPRLQERIFAQVEEFDPVLWGRIDALRSTRLQRMKELVVEAQSDGLVRPDLDPDVWLALLSGIARTVVTPKGIASIGALSGDLAGTLAIVFFEGILTQKGREMMERKEQKR